MRDLHKFYPESIPRFRSSELKGLSLDKVICHFPHTNSCLDSSINFKMLMLTIYMKCLIKQVLIYFCKALQNLGDVSKSRDEWIDKDKFEIHANDKCKKVDKLGTYIFLKMLLPVAFTYSLLKFFLYTERGYRDLNLGLLVFNIMFSLSQSNVLWYILD